MNSGFSLFHHCFQRQDEAKQTGAPAGLPGWLTGYPRKADYGDIRNRYGSCRSVNRTFSVWSPTLISFFSDDESPSVLEHTRTVQRLADDQDDGTDNESEETDELEAHKQSYKCRKGVESDA